MSAVRSQKKQDHLALEVGSFEASARAPSSVPEAEREPVVEKASAKEPEPEARHDRVPTSAEGEKR